MLQHIPFPVLPAPPSWYPGHMTQFTRLLPTLLRRTDVVLELRDSRLPLTSINRNFEGACQDHFDQHPFHACRGARRSDGVGGEAERRMLCVRAAEQCC